MQGSVDPPQLPEAPPSIDSIAPDPQAFRREERPHRTLWTLVAIACSGLILLGLSGFGYGLEKGFWLFPNRPAATHLGSLRLVPQSSAPSGSQEAVAARVSKAVVDINTEVGGGQASGTGMILSSDGEVLTNNHVVEGATSIAVNIAGQPRSYKATVLGVDTGADVALIRVQGVSGWPTVTVADSSTLKVGEAVIAIGNALGRNGAPTVTAGTVTALNQSISAATDSGPPEQLSGLIQTNASISPGDSGGPLVNSAGQVIGMITAGSGGGRRRASTSTGFAVPSNTAVSVVNQVRSGREANGVTIGAPGYLGVEVRDLTPALASRLGLRTTSGALVAGVVSGSPADSAGIGQDSVIVAVDGSPVSSSSDLGPKIRAHKPGDRIQVSWVDSGGHRHDASVALASGPAA